MQHNRLTRYQSLGHRHGVASALCTLGYALGEAGQGQEAEARKKLQQAWELAQSIGAVPVALNALVGFVMLLASARAEECDMENSVELATVALWQPAAEQETKDRAKQLVGRLASRLLPQSMPAAQVRSTARKLDDCM